jgi:16S rRNA processing protein RimM
LATEVQSLFGEVLKTFGTDGEIIVKVVDTVPEEIKEPVFICFDGLWVPFYFKRFELRGRKAKIIFDNMESEILAEELVGKKIFYLSDTSSSSVEETSDLTGFTVIDSGLGNLGQVVAFFEYPGNPCIEIVFNEKPVLIPMNGVRKLNRRKKQIYTTLPDGLLDL